MVERPEKQISNKTPVIKKFSDNLYGIFKSEDDVARYFTEGTLCIGVTQNINGEWGYWDCDFKTNQKRWINVEIPKDVEDLKVKYGKEIQREEDYWQAHIKIFDEGINMGFNIYSQEFREYFNLKMNDLLSLKKD